MNNDLSNVYKGAVLVDVESSGVEHWQLTNDDKLLLAAGDDEILWASTANELVSELEARNPCTAGGLGRVWCSGNEHVFVFPRPVLYFPHPVLSLIRLDEILDAIKQAGTVYVAPAYYACELQRYRQYFGDCIFKLSNGSPPTIAYDPKRVSGLKRREK